MKKSDLIKIAKKIKGELKERIIIQKPYVSYSRRIERIKTDKKICAMTFDDGPTKENNITETILDILSLYSAKGTFDVIGTTENNYPDKEGEIGTPSWSGVHYDHYPRFQKDSLAGSKNCPDIISRIIKEGHEITNHTYSHILFGKKNIIYSSRNTLSCFEDVYEDVKKLHELLEEKHEYSMKLSRPPHYVDNIKGGFTSYDVYSKIGYNYLAASFDGAGWLPCSDKEEEIKQMSTPLEKLLQESETSLSGQIIFQKDGYNMALRAPVIKGLSKQLETLKKYGYKVVTVTELMQESPFADIGRDDEDFDLFNNIASKRAIVFNNNCLYPDTPMTRGELAMLLAPKNQAVERRIDAIRNNESLPYSLKAKHPYSTAILWAIENSLIKPIHKKAYPNKTITIKDIENAKMFFDTEKLKNNNLTRRNIIKAFIF